MATELNKILEERGEAYGDFAIKAATIVMLKGNLRNLGNWDCLTCAQQEALDMIVHKIGRILHGNPNLLDSWQDIAGYATLIVKILEDKSNNAPTTI